MCLNGQLESKAMSNSSHKSTNQVLGAMSPRRAEKLLCDWANLRGDVAAFRRLFGRYPEIFEKNGEESTHTEIARWLRGLLLKAWDAPDQRRREWFIHEVEAYYHKLHDDSALKKDVGDETAHGILGSYIEPGDLLFELRTTEPPDQATPLEAMMCYFRRNADQARHCPNPDCLAPYYFATKKGQKYCSEPCALPAQREAKRRWWNENRAGAVAKKKKKAPASLGR